MAIKIASIWAVVLTVWLYTPLLHAEPAVRSTAGGWEAASRYQKLYDGGTRTSIRGNVLSTEETRPYGEMEPGVQLTMDVGGKSVFVHLGPRWFIMERDINFTRGERVEIVGVKIRLQSNPAIIANEVIRSGREHVILREKSGKPRWSDGKTASAPAEKTSK